MGMFRRFSKLSGASVRVWMVGWCLGCEVLVVRLRYMFLRVRGGYHGDLLLSTLWILWRNRTIIDEMANPPPNLADILRTLSALAPQSQQDGQQPASNPSNPYHFSAPIPQPRPHFEVPSRPQPPPAAAAAPIQDASKITDWPTALRCVMRSVASNERVVGEIRKVRLRSCTMGRDEMGWNGADGNNS